MEQQSATPQPAQTGEDKTVAIVAYLTLVGFIIAIVLHGQKKTALGAFHLRQVLGIFIVGFVGYLICAASMFILIGVVLMPLFGIMMLVIWIMGLIAAANGEMKPAPIVGKAIQKWFPTAFN